MIITSAKYTLNKDGEKNAILAVIDGVQWGVPLSENNRHYQAIQQWVADGNTIEEADD